MRNHLLIDLTTTSFPFISYLIPVSQMINWEALIGFMPLQLGWSIGVRHDGQWFFPD
jgi:hypothetical protein